MENITLYEAMNMIDNYLTEKSHKVDGKTIHGTAARIADSGAKELFTKYQNLYDDIGLDNVKPKTKKSLKKLEGTTKSMKHVNSLSRGAINEKKKLDNANFQTSF